MNQGVTGLAEVIKGTSSDPAQAAAIDAFEQRANAAVAVQPSIVIQKGEQLDLALSATAPLIVPYAYDAVHAAKQSQRSNAVNFEVAEATVLLSVAQAYYACAGADELVVAREHAVSIAEETYDNAKVRVSAGVVNRRFRGQRAIVRVALGPHALGVRQRACVRLPEQDRRLIAGRE